MSAPPATPAPEPVRSVAQRELGVVLLLIAVGGAGALLCGGRAWVTLTAHRPRPLPDDVLAVSGHTLHPAVSGFAVVALAAIVAILASGLRLRRGIGVVLGLAGVGVAWQGVLGLAAVGSGRALELIQGARSGVGITDGAQIASVPHRAWPILVVLAGFVIAVAGVLTVLRAGRWATLSRRYEAPAATSRSDRALATDTASEAAATIGPTSPAPNAAATAGASIGARTSEASSGSATAAVSGAVSGVVAPSASVPNARDLALWKQLDRGEDPTA